MQIILGLIGIVFASVLIKFREHIGEMLGEPAWANKVGGIYNVVIFVAIFIYFWSIAYMTNTQDIFFAPLINLLPHKEAGSTGIPGTEF